MPYAEIWGRTPCSAPASKAWSAGERVPRRGLPDSEALKNSGLGWTEDNLRTWIADSVHTVPNTLMPDVSINDPAEQIYLIAYIKTLSLKRRLARWLRLTGFAT
jgi:hypothetical protein